MHESGPLLNSGDVGLVSTAFDNEKDRFRHVVSYTPTPVKCFRWKTFVNRLKYKQFDLISIDIEGGELDRVEDGKTIDGTLS